MINKKKHTLVLLQTVERLFKRIRTFVEVNSDIFELTKNEPFELLIEDKSKYSDFQFSVSNPTQNNSNKIFFEAEFNPTNSVSLATKKIKTEENSIVSLLERWTNLIKAYNKTELSAEESILNEYEQEFYANFEILDEDADTKPYELEKQVIIHTYFVNVIHLLKRNEQENEGLIKEAEEIKDNIPSMTKRTTVKKISRFFAKVRKKSLPLLKEVLELGRKEVFKRGIKFLLNNFGEWITMIG
ncbi:hypothetical protein LV716_09300 [Flagellimonas sp. HMM57]|uniref:hypothetical protein n=1 Tax=unclassified Flagellimonas TaxID=2644544 RepID=UPI0013D268FC|nr:MULTISPECIES: hypothetical protein [unclassified Flagellimonas]UII74462.1 hypothetical protein LV716_09300 [Flagellimonas sp. HMM57]